MPMRTLTAGLGSYVSDLFHCRHVMDRDQSFLNQLFKKEELQGMCFVRELYVLLPAMCRAPVLSTNNGTLLNSFPCWRDNHLFARKGHRDELGFHG